MFSNAWKRELLTSVALVGERADGERAGAVLEGAAGMLMCETLERARRWRPEELLLVTAELLAGTLGLLMLLL